MELGIARPWQAFVVITCLAWLGCARSPAAKEANFLARGKALLQRKDYGRAALEFRNASKVLPKDAEPWYQLGMADLGANDPAGAVLALRQATRLDPKHAAAQLQLSELMVRSRQKVVLQDAERRLDDVLSVMPDEPAALDALALAELKLGKPEDAEEHLQQALQKFPGHIQSSAALAGMQYARKDFAGAEDTLQKAVAKAPRSADAALALAHLYIVEKKIFQAEAELRRVLQFDPRNSTALRTLGGLRLSQGRIGEADETFRKLASIPGADLKYIHAAFLIQQGRKDAAVAELEKMASASPSDHTARMHLVAAYIIAGRTADALKQIGEALRRNPKDSDALLQRSQIYLNSGRTAEAEADIQQVLHFDPASADAHYGLSRVYAVMGMQQSRKQQLGEVVRLQPNLLGPRIELARTLLAEGQPQAALDTIDAAPDYQKATLPAIVGRNWVLLVLGRNDELKQSIEQGLSLGKSDVLLLQKGLLRTREKDFAGGRAMAIEVMKENPANLNALNLLIQTELLQNRTSEALERLRQVALDGAKSPRTQVLVGKWFERLGSMPEARTAITNAKKLNPRYVVADLALAELDMREGRLDQARAGLSSVISTQPRNETAHLMLATLEYATHNQTSALEQYQAAVEVNPDDVKALNAAAYLLATTDPDGAMKYAKHANELSPDNAMIQDTLGWVCYRKGLYREALHYLQSAVATESTPVRQFHLAMSYFKVGDQQLGRENLEKALAKDPNLPKTEVGW
jgi:tetratricopeptide (TPR) repeat protein